MSSRNLTDDVIRVISIIFVIIIHTPGKPWDGIPFLNSLITTIIFFSNSFFFMLSGKYNIRQKFSCPKDYVLFYKKKAVDILFPYVTVSFLLSLWNMLMIPNLETGSNPTVVFFVKYALKDLFSENISTHLWFMFCLLGFIVSAPFLSKMFHAMDESELHILFVISILWNTVVVLIFPFFNKNFYYTGWFLWGWIIHFCMGYYLDRIINSENTNWVYIVGSIGLIINVFGMTFVSERFTNPTDLTPSFIMSCLGAMYFLTRKIRINNAGLKQIICFLSKHTFLIYLVHYNILNHITTVVAKQLPNELRFVLSVTITFFLSLLVAVIINSILYPCKRFLKGILNV